MKRTTEYNVADLLAMDQEALEMMVDLDPEILLAYTPAALRTIGKKDRAFAEFIGHVLRGHARKTDTGFADGVPMFNRTEKFERDGFECALTDYEHLMRLSEVATNVAMWMDDTLATDEHGWAAKVAAEEARVAAVWAAREARLAAKAAAPAPAPVAAPVVVEAPRKGGLAIAAHTADWELEDDEDFLVETEQKQAVTVETINGEAVERELYMPAVREGYMHLPNVLCGSAILRTGARAKGRQRWDEKTPLVISRVSGYKAGEVVISYSGEELRPGDIETWNRVLTMSAGTAMGHDVYITPRAMLEGLGGRGTGGNAYAALREELARLQAAIVHIKATDPAFIEQMAELFPNDPSVQNAKKTGFVEIKTHLLGTTVTDGRTWTVEVPKKLRAMFGKKLSSWFDEAAYFSLKSDTARRLFLLYASHVSCWPMKLAELREFLGSSMAADNKFRDQMDAAHDELKAAGLLKGWKYDQSTRRLNSLCYIVERKVKPQKGYIKPAGKAGKHAPVAYA